MTKIALVVFTAGVALVALAFLLAGAIFLQTDFNAIDDDKMVHLILVRYGVPGLLGAVGIVVGLALFIVDVASGLLSRPPPPPPPPGFSFVDNRKVNAGAAATVLMDQAHATQRNRYGDVSGDTMVDGHAAAAIRLLAQRVLDAPAAAEDKAVAASLLPVAAEAEASAQPIAVPAETRGALARIADLVLTYAPVTTAVRDAVDIVRSLLG